MLMPLELKSGKKCYGAEHMMQVALYSLLMPERYGGGRRAGQGGARHEWWAAAVSQEL